MFSSEKCSVNGKNRTFASADRHAGGRRTVIKRNSTRLHVAERSRIGDERSTRSTVRHARLSASLSFGLARRPLRCLKKRSKNAGWTDVTLRWPPTTALSSRPWPRSSTFSAPPSLHLATVELKTVALQLGQDLLRRTKYERGALTERREMELWPCGYIARCSAQACR